MLNGSVGAELTLSNTSLCCFILDFNHAMDGTPENNMIFGGFKSALSGGKDVALVEPSLYHHRSDGTICFNINHTAQYTYGGWKGCDFRYDILGATSTPPSQYNANKTTSTVGYDATQATLTNPVPNTMLAALPSDLRAVMRLWTRWVDGTGNASNTEAGIKETVDAITLLAECEIADRKTANQYEQNHSTKMAYYAAGNDIHRYRHNDTTQTVIWWLCSQESDSNTRFCCVYYNNLGLTNDYVQDVFALAPAWKV